MRTIVLALLVSGTSLGLFAQELFRFDSTKTIRWSSFENPLAADGMGGKENHGAKGHPFQTIHKGDTIALVSATGAGIIERIWLTVSERSPVALRSIRIQMFWDGTKKPAVDVPLGDFFGIGLGATVPFENEFFSEPEGRSFNCVIPMPFRLGAKIVLISEYEKGFLLFYKINFQSMKRWEADMMYFHAAWSRRTKAALGEDFEIMPKVAGCGRYLGANIGVQVDSAYGDTWWGEGEVKIFKDRDSTYPSLVGTGTEDYIGTGWGQGKFINRYQGCTIADEKQRRWAFYRFHVPDPVFFNTSCLVTIQQMGGGSFEKVKALVDKGVALVPVTTSRLEFVKLLEYDPPMSISEERFPKGWVNFYRSDDISATSYFYLNKPVNNLPPLAPVANRINGL
jgi:hypothetical protein